MNPGYDGDPRIFIDKNGAFLDYRDGQPVMDEGLENHDLIALLTTPGWVGNDLFEPDEAIGSDFEQVARASITLTSINNTEDAARRALEGDIAETSFVDVSINNPSGARLDVVVRRAPPGGNIQSFLLTRDGAAWINQALNPASER